MILDMLCLDPFPRHTCLRGSCPLKPRRHSVRVQARRRVTLPIVQALQTRPKRSTSPRTSVNKGIPIELKIDKPQNVMDTLEQPDATAEQAVLLSKPSSAWQTLLKSLSSRVPPRVKGLMLVNLMTLIMSTNFVIVKDAECVMDPFTFLSLRFIIAALPFVPLLSQTETDSESLRGGVEIGIWSLLGYSTQSIGLLTTDASRVSFLSALTVILVPIIVGLSGRGVSKVVWGSAAMAMVGVSLLSGTGMGGSISSGDLLSLASAAFIAIQIVRTENLARRLSLKQQISALGFSMMTVAIGSTAMMMAMHPESFILGIQHLNNWSLQSAATWIQQIPKEALIFTGFVSTDMVLLSELMALKSVDSTDAAIVYTMEPVLGALWAYLFLGERWGPVGWVGASLIIGSSFVTQMTAASGNAPEEKHS